VNNSQGGEPLGGPAGNQTRKKGGTNRIRGPRQKRIAVKFFFYVPFVKLKSTSKRENIIKKGILGNSNGRGGGAGFKAF